MGKSNPSLTNVRFPTMSAVTWIALLMSVRTVAQEARAAQVRASRASAANTARPRRKDEDPPAVPVAIPSGVSACVRRMGDLCESLERACEDTGAAAGRRALRRIARRYALRWQALRAFVGVFAGLDASEGFDPSALRALIEKVFGAKRSLAFLKGTDRAVWTAGRQLLARLESSGLGERVSALGGGLVLAQLKAEHAAYGAALGVTQARPVSVPRNVAGLVAQARAVLGDYVLKVTAMVDAEVAGSAELAAMLLAPIEEVARGQRASSRSAARKAAPSTPVANPAPATPPVAAPAMPVAAPAAPTTDVLRPTGTG
jgi:hypothetical protein